MKSILPILFILVILGCDIKLGHPKNPLGPDTEEGNVEGTLISYDAIKKNYDTLPGSEFLT